MSLTLPLVTDYGTSGQVLTSNGAGTAPTFQTAAASGGEWELVAEAELASASSTLIDATSISTDFDAFRITFFAGANSNDAADLKLRLNNDSGASQYLWQRSTAINTTHAASRNSETYLPLTIGVGLLNNYYVSGSLIIVKPLTGFQAFIHQMPTCVFDNTNLSMGSHVARWNNTADKINRINIFSDGSNTLKAGSFALIEGYKKT